MSSSSPSTYPRFVPSASHPDDAAFMQRALALAAASVGLASPNPQVGCVLVRDGHILGEGAHLFDQFDHAEIVALKQARSLGHDPAGSTAYVTLEPCSHHGRTGPCANALIEAGIARCVVATADPNPAVSGQGITRLHAAGIAIEVGLLEAPARALNEAFAWSITRAQPFVILKAALSVDGFLAPPPSTRTQTSPVFLTGPAALAEVQLLRHVSDAILTGIGTILADDPLLTDRSGLPRRRPLLRIVLDSHLRTPPTSRVFHPTHEDLWIFCSPGASPDQVDRLTSLGARIIPVAHHPENGLNLVEILHHLHAARINSVLLECGSTLNAAFLRDGLVQRVLFFYAPAELGPGSIPFASDESGTYSISPFTLEQRLTHLAKCTLGPDVSVSGLLHDPWAASSL